MLASPGADANRSRATTLGLSEAKALLLEGVFKTMTAAIAAHPPNRDFFQEQISRTLGGALQLTGVLQVQPVALRVCSGLIDLAVENLSNLPAVATSAVQNPEAIRVTLEILPSCPSPVQMQIFSRINSMAAALKHNVDAFAKAGVLQFVLTQCVLRLLTCVGRNSSVAAGSARSSPIARTFYTRRWRSSPSWWAHTASP